MSDKNRVYMIYDGRARLGGTDAAVVLGFYDSLDDARRNRKNHGDVIFSYYIEGRGYAAVDEREESDA